MGAGFNQFTLDDHDLSRTGYQAATLNSSIYGQAGYQFRLTEQNSFAIKYSIGEATYRNELFDSPETFEDKALYNNLTFRFEHILNHFLSYSAYAGYRLDFMKTDVPPEISDLYDTVSYINAGISINITVFKDLL